MKGGTLLTQKEADWIAKRRQRWNILLAVRNQSISLLEAENRLRELDSK